MSGPRRQLRALAIVVLACLLVPAAAQAKKKKGGNVFSQQVTVNAPVPDGVANAASVPLVSTINVPKRFKGKVVRDVNVTGVQTTGTGATAAANLWALLVSPNGRTVYVFQQIGTTSIGPFTIDDDTLTSICNTAAPCGDGTRLLYPPFAGTANTIFNAFGGFPTNGPLATFDGVRMKGTWTFIISDVVPAMGTSVFNSWGLRITGKPG